MIKDFKKVIQSALAGKEVFDHFAPLVGVAPHPDGSLLVSDDTNGAIYRVSHQ